MHAGSQQPRSHAGVCSVQATEQRAAGGREEPSLCHHQEVISKRCREVNKGVDAHSLIWGQLVIFLQMEG